MATFVLIHGGGDVGWSWHLVEAELRVRGHDVVAPDLPCEDDSAGFSEYADAVLDAIGKRGELVVVGHSLGGFTAPLVCDRTAAELLVLVAGMIPAPGERAGEWWANTGYQQESREAYDDELALYFHDVPPELAAEALRRERHQSDTPTQEPWPLASWPDVPTRFLLCRDDRVFPAAFMRRVARERLGIAADEIDGGHCVALSRPRELAERLDGYHGSRVAAQ
jgi:pimeloyl-ACP methyl ester carboxylesterase